MAAAHDLFRDSTQVGNMRPASRLSRHALPHDRELDAADERLSNASFSPDLIAAMDEALAGAVATLPHPVSSTRVQHILRSAKQGEK